MSLDSRYEPHLENAIWAGRYFNGVAPVAVAVKVTPLNGGLLLTQSETGEIIRHCPGENLILLNFTENERRVDLSLLGEDGVRLTVEGIGVRAQLARHVPKIGGHIPETGVGFSAKIVGGLVLFLAIAGLLIWQFQRILPSLLPDSYVHTMGEGTVEFVYSMFGEQCTVPAGNRALDVLTNKVQGDTKFSYDLSVVVIDTPMVNALAAPGGRIVIFRGLIDEATSPEEVAGVLGHEMGHVFHKHSLKRLSQTMGIELMAALLGGANLGNLSQQLIMMSFSREAEHEADLAAIDLLNDAQISTKGVAEFFSRIDKEKSNQSQNSFSNYFSSHPPPPNRAALYDAAALDVAPVLSAEAWQDLREICVKPEPEKQEEELNEEA